MAFLHRRYRLYVGRILHHVDSQSSGKISYDDFLNVFARKSWKKKKKKKKEICSILDFKAS